MFRISFQLPRLSFKLDYYSCSFFLSAPTTKSLEQATSHFEERAYLETQEAQRNNCQMYHFIHVNGLRLKYTLTLTFIFMSLFMETDRTVAHLWKVVFAHALYHALQHLSLNVTPTR